ncbi:MAG: ATP-binding protein, partial [Bacteroidota bacterium]
DDMPGIIKLFVKDTGIGIPEKFREDIFKSFFQVDNHTSRRYEGNGLGLTIANSLCKKMGVKLHLISEENKGSKFYFYLPCLNKAAIMDHGSFNTADMINFSDDLASASDFQGRPDASSPASG